MAEFEKLICGDCKGITEIPTKRGKAATEATLWAIFILFGIIYSIWRRKKPKKICQYCGGNFLLPADSPFAADLLKPITKK